MELDLEEDDQELMETEVVNNLKPVHIAHILELIKTMAIISADRTFVENYDNIYKKVQERIRKNTN